MSATLVLEPVKALRLTSGAQERSVVNDYHRSDVTQSRRLPPYQAIFAVDTVRFTDNRSADQPYMSATVPAVLEESLCACSLGEVWEARRFPQGTGDGYVFGASPEYLPLLVDPLLDRLQLVLEDRNRELAARHRDLRLRLRVSLHVGPVPDDGEEGRESVGEPINYAFRLLDSIPIKNVLRNTNPDVTQMAAIVSQRLYDDVIRAGYTGLHPDRFEPATAEVPGKDFAEPAWLYVPSPSRGVKAHWSTNTPVGSTHDNASTVGDSSPRTTVHGNVGQAITAQHVSGEFKPVFHRGSFAPPLRPEEGAS
jgi:class 3 adenylate cyclase